MVPSKRLAAEIQQAAHSFPIKDLGGFPEKEASRFPQTLGKLPHNIHHRNTAQPNIGHSSTSINIPFLTATEGQDRHSLFAWRID
jgi:hypothetical protein